MVKKTKNNITLQQQSELNLKRQVANLKILQGNQKKEMDKFNFNLQ